MEKIKDIKKKTSKYEIQLYSNEKFYVSDEIMVKYKLKDNLELEEEEITAIKEEWNYISCKDIALKYIKNRMHSEREIEEYLKGKKYSYDIIEKVIAFMREYEFIDDIKFAEEYINQNMNKGIGYNKILFYLSSKGIASETTALLKEKYFNSEDEYERAKEISIKHIELEGISPKSINKLGRKLYTKGYSEEIIFEIIESYQYD